MLTSDMKGALNRLCTERIVDTGLNNMHEPVEPQ